MRKSPARHVVDTFLGARPTARAVGVDPRNVFHWLKRGKIPRNQMGTILLIARELGLDITPEDLIFGREVK